MKYLRHRQRRDVVLVCDDQFHPMAQTPARQQTVWPLGFYLDDPLGWVGVFASTVGPIFFVNQQQWLWSANWSITIKTIDDQHQVCWQDAEGQRCWWTPITPLEVTDPWSSAQVDDFWLWLAAKRHDAEFVQIWTIESPSAPDPHRAVG